MTRRGRRPVRGWLVSAAAAVILLIAPLPASLIERVYSRGVYPWLQAAVTTATNLVPWAVIDLLIAVVTIGVVLRAVLLARVWRHEGAARALWDGARRLVRAAAVLTVLFLVLWGFNYRRVPLAASLDAPPPPSVDVLVDAIAGANRLAASLRPSIGADDQALAQLAVDLEGPLRQALGQIGRSQLFTPGRPKTSYLLTPFFSRAGVTGMLNPFALESIVHPGLVPAERAFVLAHEWAHLAGQGDEAEASAVGWLACMRAGPAAAYSASLYLIMEAGGALRGPARQQALADLDEGVRADLALIAARIRAQQDPQVQRAASRVYDEYLRANRVEDGTASYGRALSLILSPSLRGMLDRYAPSDR